MEVTSQLTQDCTLIVSLCQSNNPTPTSSHATSQHYRPLSLTACFFTVRLAHALGQVLTAGTLSGSVYLLGKLHGEPAIVHVQRTAIDDKVAPGLVKDGLESLEVFLENRPVSIVKGWLELEVVVRGTFEGNWMTCVLRHRTVTRASGLLKETGVVLRKGYVLRRRSCTMCRIPVIRSACGRCAGLHVYAIALRAKLLHSAGTV